MWFRVRLWVRVLVTMRFRACRNIVRVAIQCANRQMGHNN